MRKITWISPSDPTWNQFRLCCCSTGKTTPDPTQNYRHYFCRIFPWEQIEWCQSFFSKITYIMNSMWFVFSLRNPPCLFEKCYFADDLKLCSKSGYAFSAVCVFSKEHLPPISLTPVIRPMIWSFSQNHTMNSVRFLLFFSKISRFSWFSV